VLGGSFRQHWFFAGCRLDIYGYHWWFPFHEIPCPPELTHKINFWLHSPPEPTCKELEKKQLFFHENPQFFEGFEIPKTSDSLMDVFQIPETG